MRGRRYMVLGAAAATALFGLQGPATASTGAAGRALRPEVPAHGAGWVSLTPAQQRALARDAREPVIVVLRDSAGTRAQLVPGGATSRASMAATQRPLLQELRRVRATHVTAFRLIDAVAATVSPAEAARLASEPAVARVVPDTMIRLAAPTAAPVPSGRTHTGPALIPPDHVCSAQPQLNPQADTTVGALSSDPKARTAASLGYTGKGVKVAFIADGIDTRNANFLRPDGKSVFIDYRDFSGSGTGSKTGGGEAFLDAGSIAAQGTQVYDVARYSELPSAVPCRVRIEGVAPGASLVGLDVFGNEPAVTDAVFLQAISWAVLQDHVNVLNESFGANPFPDAASLDLIDAADEAAVAHGVTVVASSGDSGVTNTIGSPASDPKVISVGASTTYRLYLQIGLGGARFPGVKGYLDDNISSISSGGEDQAGRTIDLVAPGDLNWLPCSSNDKRYTDCKNYANKATPVMATGGTSEASPITAGVAALVIQAYREAHVGRTPSPAVVKRILTSTARPIGAPGDQEGAGLVDAYQAVLAARSYGRAARGSGATVLLSSAQLDAAAAPATADAFTERVTNNGPRTVRVDASTRRIGAYRTVKAVSVKLSDTASRHFLDWAGKTDNYAEVRFTVPAGEDRLSASIAYHNRSKTDLDARVRLTLIDPHGRLAAYSVPQGDGNYGNVQVAAPAAGQWRAYISSRVSSAGGTTGTVVFGASVARWTSLGGVAPSSLTLRPGATGSLTVHARTPATPGDEAGALMVRARAAGAAGPGATLTASAPIVLRSLVPLGKADFTGVWTGGNGRDPVDSLASYYQIRLPAGTPELNASVTIAAKESSSFTAELVDPSGEAQSVAADATLLETADNLLGIPSRAAELHVLAPAAGTWTLVVDLTNRTSFRRLSEGYTVAVDETPVPVTASGLPDSATTTVASGSTVQGAVTVTNTGPAPQAYFVDARLDQSATYVLAPATLSNVAHAPGSTGIPFVVPSDTSAILWLAQSSKPVMAEAASAWGDPDLIGSVAGKLAGGTFAGGPVTPGLWAVTPQLIGPDGKKGVAKVKVLVGMEVQTAAFDPAAASGTGDLWPVAVAPQSQMLPIIVPAGATVSIPVAFSPSGKAGTVVKGTVYVDDADQLDFGALLTPQADQAAAVPYEYTIGAAVPSTGTTGTTGG